jgi:lysophospholipase L1-like esterase
MIRIRHIVNAGLSMVLGFVVVAVGAAPVASAAPSGSNRTCTTGGPITAGLWTGFNMATGSTGCGGAATANTGGSRGVGRQYVALGDSVAAGLGLSPTVPGSDVACGASTQAYPALVAANLGKGYHTVACSGATVGDLFTEQHLSGTTRDIEPQLDQAFAAGTPDLMTLTAGANDIHWASFIKACYATTCGTSTDQSLANGLVRAMQYKLAYALSSVQRRSHNAPPMVVVTGYYQPLSAACVSQQAGLTAAELTWLRNETTAFNQAIATTVSYYPFARFAPVNFNGHELCTSDSWIQGPNAAAPFHPTARGQQALAQAILAKIRQ